MSAMLSLVPMHGSTYFYDKFHTAARKTHGWYRHKNRGGGLRPAGLATQDGAADPIGQRRFVRLSRNLNDL